MDANRKFHERRALFFAFAAKTLQENHPEEREEIIRLTEEAKKEIEIMEENSRQAFSECPATAPTQE